MGPALVRRMYWPDRCRLSQHTDRFRPDKGRGMLMIHRRVRERMFRSNYNSTLAEPEVLPHVNCFHQMAHGKDLRVCHGEEHSLPHHPIRRHDVVVSDTAVRRNQHRINDGATGYKRYWTEYRVFDDRRCQRHPSRDTPSRLPLKRVMIDKNNRVCKPAKRRGDSRLRTPRTGIDP